MFICRAPYEIVTLYCVQVLHASLVARKHCAQLTDELAIATKSINVVHKAATAWEVRFKVADRKVHDIDNRYEGKE